MTTLRRALPLISCVALSAPALAQPSASGFSAARFEPAEPGSDWLTLDSLDLRGRSRPAAGLTLDWGRKPLVLYRSDGDELAAIVKDHVVLHFRGALVIGGRARLGVAVPISIVQAGETGTLDGVTYRKPAGGGMGDARLAGDVRLLGDGDARTRLALGARLYLPTGSREDWRSDGQIRLTPQLSAAGDGEGWAYAARLGVPIRRKVGQGAAEVGTGIELGAAAGWRGLDGRLLVGPELSAGSIFSDLFASRATPVELVLGAHMKVGGAWRVAGGVGPGLSRGPGAPQVRFVAAVEWVPPLPPPDRDRDGVPDPEDACPDAAGPRSADARGNGCPPPPDSDRDGVVDAEDACPKVAGGRSADPRTNGCPPPAPPPPTDTDLDGVLDRDDACPEKPGLPTDDPKTNGCPPDRDKDGIADPDDACPDVIGATSTDPNRNGCPTDRDVDGIPDLQDACPEQAGLPDPDPAKNGCPLARVDKEQIRIREQVKFQTKSAKILPESDALIEAVATVIKEHREIKRLRIEGHTDDVGSAAYNKRLSHARAKAVLDALTKRGIDKRWLVSVGHGEAKPIDDNKTEQGRQNNRRVEFHIEETSQ